MTVSGESTTPETTRRSRRVLLTGVMGGIAAWAAGALGRSSPVRAGVDGDLVLDVVNTVTSLTGLVNNTSNSTVFSSVSNQAGTGVSGYSQAGVGVYAQSTVGTGLYGFSNDGTAVVGFNNQTVSNPAVRGASRGLGTGIQGWSGSSPSSPPAAKPQTGVFGYSAQSTSSRGVWGETTGGIGVYGRAVNGFAGYFQGKVFMSSFQEMIEVATPAAPGANRARLFVRDNGTGKTQLCVRFATGSVKLLAQET